MATTRIIPMHLNKGKSIKRCISERLDYGENPDKTENGFANIGSVYNAPKEIVEIIQSLPREAEQGRQNGAPSMDDINDVPVDEQGEISIPQETVINQTDAILGEKIYEVIPVKPVEDCTGVDDMSPKQAVVNNVATKIAETLHDSIWSTQARQNYNLTQTAQIEQEREHKLQEAQQNFNKEVEAKTQQLVAEAAQQAVVELETKKEEQRKRSIDGDIREHLRGFARTIPSFIMAYGDEKLCLQNFDTYPTEEVFKEVTSISVEQFRVEQFRMLRDVCEYPDPETGEIKEYPGGVFDGAVFDASVQEFMAKKRDLANYFAETSDEDIFDYIPPQKTNQIFTPKKVVQMMVDQLVETDPHIFESPDKTFVDFYMKSGLYITEIVKRLYRNKVLQSLIPDDHECVKHILECQVFGFAPTQIIYDTTMSYTFGFDETANSISRRNFFCEDTLGWAQRGELQKLLNAKLGDRA